MTHGECNCGAIGFEISAEISDIFICHCSICRRSTGAGGIAVAVVKNEAFNWVRGEEQAKTWYKPGHDWETSFCVNCGSTLPGRNDEARMYVPVGLISSSDEKFKVAHHIWVGSKASWEEIADSGKQHPRGYEDKSI